MKEIEFTIGDGVLAGIKSGEESANTVLFLHGWLDNAASFAPLLPELSQYHCVAIDWPGHGHSSHRSNDAHYHFIDYVYDLLRLFEHNNWPALDIVAHSMGGMIASAFAAAFPEKVNSLTLIDSIGFISADEQQSTQQLRDGMLSRMKLQSKRKPIHAEISSAIQARMQVSDLKYEQAELIVKRGIESVEQGVTWRADSRLRNTSPYRLSFKQAAQYIKDIEAPVQLIYGSDGLEMIELGLKHYAPLFKHFTAHELKGGHHLHMECVQQVSKLIDVFIKSADENSKN